MVDKPTHIKTYPHPKHLYLSLKKEKITLVLANQSINKKDTA